MINKDGYIVSENIVEPYTEGQINPSGIPSTQMIRGKQIYFAPARALTAVDNNAFSSSTGAGDHVDASAITILNNMRTRIAELEERLQKLELLRKP